jgi:16S rRNA (uracil1498-N3)-methyltransferase
MRNPRVYIEQALAVETERVLPEAASNHLLRVLRMRPGAPLTLFNGRGGEYQAELLGSSARGAQVRIREHRAIERESPLQLTLMQGISRGERMDQIMQKATELGVTRIVPVSTEFCVVQLDEKQALRRREHWQAVVISACEQCGRNRVPEVAPVVDFAIACSSVDAAHAKLLLSPEASMSLAAAAAALSAATLLIGPEGGLSEREELLASQRGFTACSLGPRVLRTETAPLAALAVLQALAGDLLR